MSSRSKCRAIGCKAHVDCIVLERVMGRKRENEPDWVHIGLCKKHTQHWLDWLADPESRLPITYKAWKPIVQVLGKPTSDYVDPYEGKDEHRGWGVMG